ncbi:hypothetical protein [Bradyrhizobium sp. Leo170]|uniref:hypothetical protein n=1 Tax=Bradyrhizobium sp. Leo170 TaxID=1571199 RepID=UPI00102E3531|nr:hypothetical protein [Bradyrhizobium sp. Leo170]TAI60806.1 hypothetical protein CWO89_38635 [Bradyrhizobium sp. Leo170]
MPYHVYSRQGPGTFRVIVETARQALEKAAPFAEEGHPDVVFKDLLGTDCAGRIGGGDEEP